MKIYYCNVKPLLEKKLFWQGMKYVDNERRIKIEQLKHPLDKARSLGCSLLYRYLWIHDVAVGRIKEQCTGLLYEAISIRALIEIETEINIPKISIGKNGKPDVHNRYNVHISFSHSGDMAAVSYQTGEFPIGMDIQIMSSRKVIDYVAKFIMSGVEFEYYDSEKCNDKCSFFYEVLCCKEAYTKMTGEGILTDFGTLSITAIRQKYQLFTLVIEQDGRKYMLAVCCGVSLHLK